MNPISELPDDPALPALVAIRKLGLADAIPALRLEASPVELLLRAYKPGAHATIEARASGRLLAIKAYADDPAHEAAVYQALAAAGLAGDSGVRVPPLLAWERDLRALVVGWLEGRSVRELLKGGQGRRAGELVAAWLRRAASFSINLGPAFGSEHMLSRVRKWVAALSAADALMGTAAVTLAELLTRTQPQETVPRLVHGALHDRNVLDLNDGPGVIDWQRFGQGPAEIEAGKFLACVSRLGLDSSFASEAVRAEEAFHAGTAGLLDQRTLAWHRAAALLSLADRPLSHRTGDWLARARALLAEAARFAQNAD